jgi:3-methyladenine DNA glycosylase AlkC
MSTLLKDLYSPAFYNQFVITLKKTIPSVDKKKFLDQIFTPAFESYELKERMAHTAHVLHRFFPQDYKTAAPLLCELVEQIKVHGPVASSIEYLFIPEYIYLYGLNDYTRSVTVMEKVTQFITCEFAIRHFILRYEEKMIPQMLKWSTHKSRHVRRLASEGSRPRLPWAMALPKLKKDPSPILPILENLKQDSCEVVRRSVANNLNDISKDNPLVALQIAKKWKGLSTETDAIIKHALRTLLKASHPTALSFYKLTADHFKLSRFKINTASISIGEYLQFECIIENSSNKTQTLRLEYAVYYLKNNGTRSKKVFKISERTVGAGEKMQVVRRQSFKPITTRVFYRGVHQLSIIMNGNESKPLSFELS